MPQSADQIRCTFQPLEPTLALALAASDEDKATWLNIAKVGDDYWHPRFREFRLAASNFAEMVKTFKAGIYPEPPTQLPCDYDHRSLKPQSPEDGKASGWIQDLETRDQGTTLWAKVEFTPPALLALQNKEWRFLSGVFAPKWKTFRRKELGWTFLGMAITNYPTMHNLQGIALPSMAIPFSASEQFENSLVMNDLEQYIATDVLQASLDALYSRVEQLVSKESSMSGKKTADGTITVKDDKGQDVVIALASLADIDAILALGRGQAPDPTTVVARTDFDALNVTVKTLSTELADERTKRLAAEERDRKRTVSEWIRTGLIFPKEEVLALANYDLFAGLVADRGTVVVLNREQGSGSRAKEDAPGYLGASDSIRTAAEKYATDHKVPFAEAVIAVSASIAADAVNDRAMALRREHSL